MEFNTNLELNFSAFDLSQIADAVETYMEHDPDFNEDEIAYYKDLASKFRALATLAEFQENEDL